MRVFFITRLGLDFDGFLLNISCGVPFMQVLLLFLLIMTVTMIFCAHYSFASFF